MGRASKNIFLLQEDCSRSIGNIEEVKIKVIKATVDLRDYIVEIHKCEDDTIKIWLKSTIYSACCVVYQSYKAFTDEEIEELVNSHIEDWIVDFYYTLGKLYSR
jgi:hypothetical protein